CQQGYSSPYNF
nr:immunoglobulin light chain junction region [Macaca mulatta]